MTDHNESALHKNPHYNYIIRVRQHLDKGVNSWSCSMQFTLTCFSFSFSSCRQKQAVSLAMNTWILTLQTSSAQSSTRPRAFSSRRTPSNTDFSQDLSPLWVSQNPQQNQTTSGTRTHVHSPWKNQSHPVQMTSYLPQQTVFKSRDALGNGKDWGMARALWFWNWINSWPVPKVLYLKRHGTPPLYNSTTDKSSTREQKEQRGLLDCRVLFCPQTLSLQFGLTENLISS